MAAREEIPEWIEPRELKELLDKKAELSLIDLRMEDRFERAHLPGAVQACIFEMVFPETVARLAPDKGRRLIIYGSHASQEAQVGLEKLKRLGYRKVTALVGGVEGWEAAGFGPEGERASGQAEPEEGFHLSEGIFGIDPARSRLLWTGRGVDNLHFGRLSFSRGELRLKSGRLHGGLTLDMTSIRDLSITDDPDLKRDLEKHLTSDDFFFVERFPEASLTILSGIPIPETPLGRPNYEIRAELTLKGIKAGLEFPATLALHSDGFLSAEAHLGFDRTRWGVIYGSGLFFRFLGYHLVFDEISVEVNLVAEIP